MKQTRDNESRVPERRARGAAGVFASFFAVGMVALILLGGFFFFKSSDAPSSSQDESIDGAAPGERRAQPDAGEARHIWKERGASKAPLRAASVAPEGAKKAAPSDARWVVVRPDILEEPVEGAHEDEEAASDIPEWADSVNQRVLGPKAWMAKVAPADAEAVERVLDTPIPERYPIDLRVREWSADIVSDAVHDCFDSVGAEPAGRFAVNYTLVANGAWASFEDVHISHIYQLEAPVFFDCVVGALSQQGFRSSEDGRMEVSRPFLFDGT